MKGNVNLSSNQEVYFPPSVESSFMGAHAPVKTGYGTMIHDANVNYFQSYRNDNLSKFQVHRVLTDSNKLRIYFLLYPNRCPLMSGESQGHRTPHGLIL